MNVRPDQSQDRHEPGPPVAPREQQPGSCEERHRESLRAGCQGARGDQESEKCEEGRRAWGRLRSPATSIQEREARSKRSRICDPHARPPEHPMRRSEYQLCGPLLVQPRITGSRERERVDEHQVTRPKGELSGPHVIGEIDRPHPGQEGSERRQSPGEGRPGWVGLSAYVGRATFGPFGGYHGGILRGTIRHLLGPPGRREANHRQ